MSTDSNINVLIGLTLTRAEHVVNRYDERIIFETEDGRSFAFYHSQNCCESVSVHDIEGDLQTLIGAPIGDAREEISRENPIGIKVPKYQDSFTWTTYTFATAKGIVVIRWYGSSNGYYSESVSFVETTKGEPR